MKDPEFNRTLDTKNPIEFVQNLLYYNNLLDKIDLEIGDFLRANAQNPKLYSNDLRHQYASAVFAKNLGEDWAKRLGDWNETFGISGSGTEDSKIDQINNEIGRQYGIKYADSPRSELAKKLFENYSKNKEYRNQRLK